MESPPWDIELDKGAALPAEAETEISSDDTDEDISCAQSGSGPDTYCRGISEGGDGLGALLHIEHKYYSSDIYNPGSESPKVGP